LLHAIAKASVGATTSASVDGQDFHITLDVRVSTTQQAKGELSIPDQIKQGQDYCAAKGLSLE
jgi:hypothetical protein